MRYIAKQIKLMYVLGFAHSLETTHAKTNQTIRILCSVLCSSGLFTGAAGRPWPQSFGWPSEHFSDAKMQGASDI